jgi:hypothetical protein
VIPALESDGFRYRAFWQALPEQPERLTESAAQMPPSAAPWRKSPKPYPPHTSCWRPLLAQWSIQPYVNPPRAFHCLPCVALAQPGCQR